MKSCYYLLFIWILIACNQEGIRKYPRYKSFPNIKMLTSEIISLDTVLLRYPFRIAVRDSIAIVMDLHNTDCFFHAFLVPQWNHLVSFGQRGEAPQEMFSAETFQFVSLDSIWVLDANKMQISRWRIVSNSYSAVLEEVIHLDKTLVRALDFYVMDSGILIPNYLGSCRFSRVNLCGKEFTKESEIPSEISYKEIALPALAQAWRSFIDYNPNNGVLAVATQLGEVLEIYNFKDSTHYTIFGPNGEPLFQIAEGEGIPTGIMGFSDVQVTDSFVYTVFHGRSFKDIDESLRKGMKSEDGGRFIYVFDLKGKPVKEYILDRAIYGLNVHEKEGVIYATDVNSNNCVVKFII